MTHPTPEGGDEQQAIMGDNVRPIFDAGLIDLVERDHRISPVARRRLGV